MLVFEMTKLKKNNKLYLAKVDDGYVIISISNLEIENTLVFWQK